MAAGDAFACWKGLIFFLACFWLFVRLRLVLSHEGAVCMYFFLHGGGSRLSCSHSGAAGPSAPGVVRHGCAPCLAFFPAPTRDDAEAAVPL